MYVLLTVRRIEVFVFMYVFTTMYVCTVLYSDDFTYSMSIYVCIRVVYMYKYLKCTRICDIKVLSHTFLYVCMYVYIFMYVCMYSNIQ